MPERSRTLGRVVLATYRGAVRARDKGFSLAAGGAFARFGRRSVLQLPVRLERAGRIAIGSGVFVGSDSWLQVVGPEDGPVALSIGDGSSIAGHCVLSAVAGVHLGERVLVARGAYIADHGHAFSDPGRAVLDQGIDHVARVEIADGAWLGENVVVCPGVRVGRGAVIGANSVVTRDVPDHAVAAGAPARVVRSPAAIEEALCRAS